MTALRRISLPHTAHGVFFSPSFQTARLNAIPADPNGTLIATFPLGFFGGYLLVRIFQSISSFTADPGPFFSPLIPRGPRFRAELMDPRGPSFLDFPGSDPSPSSLLF